jgi:diadenosine tetraphosphatase ApaH/serine/threonine PP2A family protein phosphatase
VGERIAFVSDLHSNLEALTAVMKDIEHKRCTKIICLGDLIGYGPDPNPILDIARRSFDLVLEGNHDEAIAFRVPRGFKRLAVRAALWTRKRVRPKKGPDYLQQRERWKYLKGLPDTDELGGWLLAHGSPVSNLDYIYDNQAALEVFERDMENFRACFVGHTHVPGIFLQDQGDQVHYVPAEEGKRYWVNARKMIVNVGSVGQPRDGDNRACWVLARDDGSFSFRRVAYEVEQTADKIWNSGLDRSLGERLFVGE